MHTFTCLLTSLVFAVHAALGCGAHRTCEHSTAVVTDGHECHEHDHGLVVDDLDHLQNAAPVPCSEEPCEPCSDSDCSYVKADKQQVDAGSTLVISFASLPLAVADVGEPPNHFDVPLCRADLSSTHLYVWHCALII